ncbi:hypothetical protein BN1195_00865 [Chryseobacterium oranimense G311]|uniref:hypothetical protein n=1 Tax=Chryseobacterium oranimense TaxID=421058 RepID=UPI000533AE73|nr:hypothetical protein [Chryseobacterium oranimense]CEJ68577.1 hypothetical protein BN1195_00865 [Chryseobacterium oranimense G311]
MENHEIIKFGKSVFKLFFLLGNICLFGYLITRNSAFAVGGYMLLIFGTFINLLFVIGFLIYGIVYQSKLDACLKAIGLLMINIPIAILYAFIGLNLN